MSLDWKALVDVLGLAPHPEGGFFREIFRSPLRLPELAGRGPRSASTSIYYLLPAGTVSAFHVVRGADEVWHDYLGNAVELHTIAVDGTYEVTRLGTDIAGGERPQAVVPADVLQAAAVSGSEYALCGCTVAPGFEFADFTVPSRRLLLRRHPEHAAVIERLTRE